MKAEQSHTGLSLLFAAGERPSTADIDSMLSSPELVGPAASITHRAFADEGWLELLSAGLTFDMVGLAPAAADALSTPRRFYGLPAELQREVLEPITLRPAPHIAGGGAMLPVVKAMAGFAAGLALHLPAKAVCWNPAQSWMDPSYFARAMLGWLSGGAFPALGLTSIERTADGGVRSEGLSFFIGQEVLMDGRSGETPVDTMRIASRVIDHLVRKHGIVSLQELQGPSGERLFAEPDLNGQVVRVWRGR